MCVSIQTTTDKAIVEKGKKGKTTGKEDLKTKLCCPLQSGNAPSQPMMSSLVKPWQHRRIGASQADWQANNKKDESEKQIGERREKKERQKSPSGKILLLERLRIEGKRRVIKRKQKKL